MSMAYAQPDQYASLKSAATALPIYAAETQLKRQGKEIIGKCPLPGHKDDSPSFTLTEKNGALLFHCFGCAVGGDVIKFVQVMNNCSFGEAVDKIRGTSSTWKEGSQKVKQVFSKLETVAKQYDTFSLSDYAIAEQNLSTSQEARQWLKSRGITLEIAKSFHLGYVQSIAKINPTHELVDKGWIVFPTIQGDRITLLKYRSVVKKDIVRKPKMRTSLYNIGAVEPFDDVFLVEGEPDCLIMSQAGFNTVALPMAGYNLEMEDRAKLLDANRIFLAGDSDAIGQQAMVKLWTELQDRTYLIKWPDAKDANEYFLKTGGNIGEFKAKIETLKREALEQPMPFMHDLVESLSRVNDVLPLDNPNRLRFPWPRIDNWAAIKPGDIMVLSATETGTGKTSWLLNVLLENAVNHGKVVVNFSAEVSPEDYARRAAAYICGKSKDILKRADFEYAAIEMKDAKFYNGYKPSANWKDVVELLKLAKCRLGADILVVDHLHFLTRSEKDEIKAQSEAMRAFKDLAIEYGIIMIVVGQPRKPQDEHRGRELQTRGIKGSESMGSDASQVFILHRKRLSGGEGDTTVFEQETKVILDKSRESEGRVTKLLFRGEICKFVEMANGEME
jgi:KaiC/GvpD/RAD55 family RecA-like ATPase